MVRQEEFVLSVFVLAQALDGALTYIGLHRFGVGMELNQLLVFYMEIFGVGLTLVGAKVLACVCGLVLHVTERHRAVAIAAGASIGVAVVPWLLALAHVA
jgi:uncharacterized membrane protein